MLQKTLFKEAGTKRLSKERTAERGEPRAGVACVCRNVHLTVCLVWVGGCVNWLTASKPAPGLARSK